MFVCLLTVKHSAYSPKDRPVIGVIDARDVDADAAG